MDVKESESKTPTETPAPIEKRKSKADDFVYKPFEWYRLVVYDFFLWCFSVIFDCFFREIRPRGAFRLPRSGPVIFVGAPHANQFVDPIILMNQVKREANRRISFLIAAKSYKQRVIGHLAACELSIPVVRPQDCLAYGKGKIYVSFEEGADQCIVHGRGTQFTKECMVHGIIALPQSLGASEVLEITSDTQLRIRKEFKNSEQVRKLLQNGTTYKKADKIDQKNVYKLVFEHLSHGNCLGIFPEGGSHDRTDLLPLKAGVAIMALGAMENDPNCNVKIVPCGMNYFNAHKFRSRAVVEFGNPIEISSELVKKYKNPETNREAVKDLLDIITTGLKAVTVTCDDYETLMVVQAARRLYAGNFAQYLPLPLIVEMNRRLVLGYQTYQNEPKVQAIKAKILKYNEMLKQLYLPDHHVEDTKESDKIRVLPILIFRVLKLMLLTVLSLPGATLFSPVFLFSKMVSIQKAKTALANSTVKIKANDVVATWKILISMGFAPLVYSFYATIGTWYYYKSESLWLSYLSRLNLVSLWITLYCCGVAVTYAALITGEQGMDLFKSIRPLYLSITSGESLKELKTFRKDLSEDITELVNTFGPELFPNDFNLLEMKDQLKVKDGVDYIDSDEEEERKTQDLRNRRMMRRKSEKRAAKIAKEREEKENKGERIGADSASGASIPIENTTESGLSLEDKHSSHSSSVSDGISLMNSDNSLTNIPMFSDYQLHMNAKNPDFEVSPMSNVQSTVSMADDFNFKMNNSSNRLSSVRLGDTHNHHINSHLSSGTGTPTLSRKSSSSQIELNFGNLNRQSPKKDRIRLSDKIRNKVREGRKKMSNKDE
ncbi:glycerol-3-phosphate O-acyltransferase 1 [[Candida] railenensis]|uniref:Glycerol-3-phosphate O-acyltransferase 1 n=1 Tax=[Candida] railenensis TaxID=45579 RepID=A0A9P0QP04_9ASCO|nr:glycerol-3-phosphate O-acyltransferase 1 [[Candida] railenensis]